MRKRSTTFAASAGWIITFLSLSAAQTGGIQRELWAGITGTAVTDLTNKSVYPSQPTSSSQVTVFEGPINSADNYGARFRGYVHPPQTGSYEFWISGDDNCELWLSMDANPANKTLIARVPGWTNSREWTKFAEQKSAVVDLQAGKRYYIEALHKEGTGGDNVAVGWKLPDGTLERPIPGTRLSAYGVDAENYATWLYSEKVFMNTSATGANITQKTPYFPVLVRLDEETFEFTQAQSGGYDLRFSTASGKHLSYEIEKWDAINKVAAVWVLVDTVKGNSADQYFWMHWGNQNAYDRSTGCEVFQYGYGHAGVWHLGQAASGTGVTAVYKDASSLGRNGTDYVVSTGKSGIVGDGQEFNKGSADHIDIASIEGTATEFTLSAWVNSNEIAPLENTSGNREQVVISNFRWWPSNGYQLSFLSTQMIAVVNITDHQWHFIEGILNAPQQWMHAAVTWKQDGTMTFYANGVSVGTQSVPAGTIYSSGELTRISSGDGAYGFQGQLDEVRHCSVARGSEWIKLCYENQRPDQNFITVGEPAVVPPTNVAANSNGTAITITWSDNSNDEDGFEIWSGADLASISYLASVSSNVTSYIHETNSCGFTALFGVKSYKGAYESPLAVNQETAYSIPCIPEHLSVQSRNVNTIEATWTDEAPSFRLESKTAGDLSWALVYEGPDHVFLHQGLLCHQNYEYRLQAVNPAGSSSFGGVVQASSGYCPIQPPTNLNADNSTPGRIVLTWSDNSDNEAGFKIFRRTGDGAYGLVGQAGAGTTGFSDNSVLCNTEYSYQVGAFDVYVESGFSNEVTIKSLYCGAGKKTAEMIGITGIAIDEQNNLIQGNKIAVVKLYQSKTAGEEVYEETIRDVVVKNGFFSIPLGLTNDVASVVRANPVLFYDVIIDGRSVYDGDFQPLTSSPYAISTGYNFYGIGSPVSTVTAPVGASYVDTRDRELYIKTVTGDGDWVKVGN